ncbi:maestro heat-like repeat-containing protein family member 2B isoform X3 [Gopherus evgoodei]|uniref:Protein maestro-like n=1 Tax=Gopherus evgoodei TaxID=1825980 RepID=A0A8C4YBL5_9SAUR|nr:maestro heat-like repeat-containing protein family member 2B isoform X3 [Gopherus evgoodei]
MPLPVISSPSLGQRDRQHTEGNPCRFSVQALESVLFKVGNARLMRELREQRTWILLENPQTHHEGVCLLVSVLLKSELVTPEIIQNLLPWVNSPTENYRVTGTAFLAQVKKHKKFLLDILIGALHDIFSSEVIGESMKALAKVLKELKEKDIGSSFRDLTQQIRTYFDDEDDALRSVAFVLFGILAQLTKKKWKAYFTEEVRKSWVTLLLHLQDPNPQVSMKCRATFHLCFPFLGLKRLQHMINKHLDDTAELNPTELQEDICRHLAKENLELLQDLYKTTLTYFYSSWEGIRAAAAKLAGIILEHIDIYLMKWLYRGYLLKYLRVLEKDPSPTVQLVATEIISDIRSGGVLEE